MAQCPTRSVDWPPRLVVCVGTVVLCEHRVLLVRQASGHSLAGRWTIPWGLVDPGEAPEAAALRETHEESGITAQIEGLLGVQNLPEGGWMALLYLCRHVGGTPTPDGGVETDRAAYLTLQETTALGTSLDAWCAWLVRRVLLGEHTAIQPCPENPYRPRMGFL
jgi:ADP-ribose pyrophosphatase YjhB (NUDIX family)